MNFKACMTEQFNWLWELLEITYWDFVQTSLPFSCFWCSTVAVSKHTGVPVNIAQIRCYHLDRDESACAVDCCVGWVLAGENRSVIQYLSPGRLLVGTRCTLDRAEQNSATYLSLCSLGMLTHLVDLPLSSRSPCMPLLRGRFYSSIHTS